MARITSKNRPLFDDDGFCHGVVARVDDLEERTDDNGKKFSASLQWTFECAGTLRPYSTLYWTSQKVGPPDEKGELSKCSRLCVALGLLQEDDLSKPDIDLDTDSAVGLSIKYRLKRHGDLYQLDDPTLTLDTADNAS